MPDWADAPWETAGRRLAGGRGAQRV